MHTRKIGDGQVEIRSDVRRNSVEATVQVNVVVRRAPLPPGWRIKALSPRDPVLSWAQWSLADDIEQMIEAQVNVLPHGVGAYVDVDDDTDDLVFWRDPEALLALLEQAADRARPSRRRPRSRDDQGLPDVLRSPDVVNGIVQILTGDDQAMQRRLQKALRLFSAPRPGAPIKDPERRKDLCTAIEVAKKESQIADAWQFIAGGEGQRRRGLTEENLEHVVDQYGLSYKHARLLFKSKKRWMAACQIVADEHRRTLPSVKMAASRGARHPAFVRIVE